MHVPFLIPGVRVVQLGVVPLFGICLDMENAMPEFSDIMALELKCDNLRGLTPSGTMFFFA